MKDEFTNRMGMFKTCLTTLNSEEYRPVWFNQPPAVFTGKVNDAALAVTALEGFCQEQETATDGSTLQKVREGAEAEAAAFALMGGMHEWFMDQHDESNAAKVKLSRSALHELRDQSLKDQLNLAISLAQGIVAGPNAVPAADYGITAAKVASAAGKVNEFVGVINAPQSRIADRKGHTGGMRAQFNAVEAKFGALDRLVVQFNGTDAGRAFVAAYQASRVVRDLGHGPGPTPPAPPAPPQ